MEPNEKQLLGSFSARFSQRVSAIFSDSYLEQLARATGFMQRRSKLKPSMFLDLLFFRNQDDSKTSLNDHASSLKLRYKKGIKKQSLHDRFSDKAVKFIKSLVDEQLKSQLAVNVLNSKHFKSVKIKDSTRFQIPEHLKEWYPGSGGAASAAGVHIQFEFDLLKGYVSDLHVTHAKRQDSTDASETVESVEKGDLIIRDLGYFDQNVLNRIDGQLAYYISRVQPKLSLYDSDRKKIDMEELLRKMKKKRIQQMTMMVTTNEIKKPVRLLVELLPGEVVNARLAKIAKEARKKNRQVTELYKTYAAFNLFITNVGEEILSTDQVRKLYHIRWQIELRFKAWKSFCQLHKVKKMNRYRFECYLYAKLLYILLNWQMAYTFMAISWRSIAKLVSINKFYKMSTDHIDILRQKILEGARSLQDHIKTLYKISRETLLLEKRKNGLGTQEILMILQKK